MPTLKLELGLKLYSTRVYLEYDFNIFNADPPNPKILKMSRLLSYRPRRYTERDTMNGGSTVLEHKRRSKEQERLHCHS